MHILHYCGPRYEGRLTFTFTQRLEAVLRLRGPKTLEEIEKTGIPGLIEVLREEGIDAVRQYEPRINPVRIAWPVGVFSGLLWY